MWDVRYEIWDERPVKDKQRIPHLTSHINFLGRSHKKLIDHVND
jgi:hypothetical protein